MGDSEVITGLGTRGSYLRADPNALQRPLSPEERALVQCVGAGAPIREILARCGLPEPKAIALLLGLRLRGVVMPFAGAVAGAARPAVTPVRPMPAVSAPPPAPAKAAAGAAVDAAAMAERVDLDEGRKREILELEGRLGGADYFNLLGVPAGAPAPDCKKAYYELTKRFHPDRYFGKNLGSFRDRVERIFKKLTEAQAVLTDANQRKAYLDAHPELSGARISSDALFDEPAVDPRVAARRAVERRARLAKHPYLAKAGKLHELIARGRENLDQGEFSKAFADLTLASQMDPRNREISDLLAKAKKGGDRRRAEQEFKEADAAEQMGDVAGAMARVRQAVSLDPENARYAFRGARLLFQRGGEAEVREAHQLARRACELEPNNVEYHSTYARILLHAKLEKNAAREYEIVLKLEPDNAAAKEQLRKLKWKI